MATDVTVVGVAGATVTIPFTSADNYVLAQYGAASNISSLPDASKFVASGAGASTTAAIGIISDVSGATITGTAANASVLAGGSNFDYTAAADGQSIFFSASGTGNLLANGPAAVGAAYYIDAGGSSSVIGTTVDASADTTTVNAYSGYLNVLAGSGGVLLNDWGANVSLSGGNATVGGGGSVTLAGGTFDIYPYSVDTIHAATVPALIATGAGNVVNSATLPGGAGISLTLADGAAVSVQGLYLTFPTDTITALGSGSIRAVSAYALVDQAGAGNLSLDLANAGQVTVDAAAGATETIATSTVPGVNANVSVSGGNFNLAGNQFTVTGSGNNTLTATAAYGVILAGATGNYTLNGGFYDITGSAAVTATGTADTISSPAGITLGLANGAAATLRAFPGQTVMDTITALGSGSVFAAGAEAVVNQTAAGNLFINEGFAGFVSVINAAAGATETIATSTVPGVNANVSVTGGNFNLAGNEFTVTGSGNNTLNATAAYGVILNEDAGTTVNLAGGSFYVASAGPGAALTFSGADTVAFASTALAASVLGAQSATLQGGTGNDIVDTITAAGATYLITGTTQNPGNSYIINPGTTNNVLYFGTVYRTAWDGVPIESYAGSFSANNVVTWGEGGSQTVFGGGSAFNFGVVNTEDGGTSGNNLLVGARTIYGGGAGDTLQAGAFTTYIQASNGNTTLIGGDGSFNGIVNFAAANETLVGTTLVGSTAVDTFVFGTGNETITGGTGTNQFTDINRATGGTTITLTDFVSGPDKVDLFSPTNAAGSGATANVSGQTNVAGDTFVQLSDGVTIRFAGISSVSASDFVTNVGTVQVGKVT